MIEQGSTRNLSYDLGTEATLQAILAALGGGTMNTVNNETPSGTIDGSNLSFVLAHSPISNSLQLFLNQGLQTVGEDYSLVGNTITFFIAPMNGAVLRAFYNY